ncbi:MAG: hypothetical protein E7253_10695 [Lachnospiraceae bacterium]|nr:hypothetical protein [Lachnospiraceae bacterium]
MRKAKRFLSLVLAFILIFANISMNVFAEDTEAAEYGQIVLKPAEGTSVLTPDGKPLESVLVTLEGKEGYWYKVGERLEFVFEVQAGYLKMFESFDNANGGGVNYDEDKEVYYGVVAAGENVIQTWSSVDEDYVGKNAVSSQDDWQEVLFSNVGFSSVVGNDYADERYFSKDETVPEGTIYWFLNMTQEIWDCGDENGNISTTYEHYMAIADAYFVNAPEMKDYLESRGMMTEDGDVKYFAGGLGDAWAWNLCDTEVVENGYKLKGIFCQGPVEETEGLTEYVDYYGGLFIDSAVELTVVDDAEHGWMIESYAPIDYYKVEDYENMGEVLYVYNEETDSFSDIYYLISISQPEADVKVVLEEGTYKVIDGMYCYSEDMEVKWEAVCSEGYTCQVKVERTVNGEVQSGIAATNGIIYGGGSVVLEPNPIPLFTIDAQHAEVEVLKGLVDMEDGTYAYMKEAEVELRITPNQGYEIKEVAAFLFDNYVVFAVYNAETDTWTVTPEYLPSTIRVTTEEIKEDIVVLPSNPESAENVTVQVSGEDAAKVENLSLFVEELAPEVKEEAEAVIIKNLGSQAEEIKLLDIFFANENGEETKVEATMVVTVPVPEGWDAANVAVYYVNSETGEMTDMEAVVSEDGKTVSFTTTHFSHYALVQRGTGETEPTVLPGDANGDGKVNSRDAVAILRHIIKLPNEKFDDAAADINGNGRVDSRDAVQILRKLIGLN